MSSCFNHFKDKSYVWLFLLEDWPVMSAQKLRKNLDLETLCLLLLLCPFLCLPAELIPNSLMPLLEVKCGGNLVAWSWKQRKKRRRSVVLCWLLRWAENQQWDAWARTPWMAGSLMYHIGNCLLREQRGLYAGRRGKIAILDSFGICLRKGFSP